MWLEDLSAVLACLTARFSLRVLPTFFELALCGDLSDMLTPHSLIIVSPAEQFFHDHRQDSLFGPAVRRISGQHLFIDVDVFVDHPRSREAAAGEGGDARAVRRQPPRAG